MRQLHANRAAGSKQEIAAPLPHPATPPLILVVDDEPVHRELHCMMLERAGYSTCTASDAVEALTLYGDLHPALVMTDLRMPGVDGLRMVELLRSVDQVTPVVMVTSSAWEMDSRRALEAGLFALLPKPVEMVDLLSAVADAVGPGCTPHDDHNLGSAA